MADNFSQADTVNAIIRTRKGTNAEIYQKIFDASEVVYSTDKKRLRVGDSTTYGGLLVGSKVWYSNSFTNLQSIEKYDLVYRYDSSKFYILTGSNSSDTGGYVLIGGSSVFNGGDSYTLPVATSDVLGGVKKGSGVAINGSGVVSVNVDGSVIQIDSDTLTINTANLVTALGTSIASPIATDVVAGKVKVPTSGGISVGTDGTISILIDNETIKFTGSQLYVNQAALSVLNPLIVRNDTTTLNVSALRFLVDSGLSAQDVTGNISLTPADSDSIGGIKLGQGLSGNNTGVTDVQLANSTTFGGGKLGIALSSNSSSKVIDVLIDNNTIQYFDDGTNKYLYSSLNINSPAVVRGWIIFNGTGSNSTYQTTINSYGLLSAYKHSTGVYTVSWPTSLSAAGTNYPWTAQVNTPALGTLCSVSMSAQTLTSTIINVVQHSGSPASADSSVVNFKFYSN